MIFDYRDYKMDHIENNSINTDVLEWLQKSADNMSRMELNEEYREKVKIFTFGDVKPLDTNNQ